MSDAQVKFETQNYDPAEPGKEQMFSFRCPRRGHQCGALVIAGRTTLKRDGQNKGGGVAQWGWDGNREKPTFTPSINCGNCWHGFIEKGRCVNVNKQDEP